MDDYELTVRREAGEVTIHYTGARGGLLRCLVYLVDSAAKKFDMSNMEMIATLMLLMDDLKYEHMENETQEIDVETIERSLRRMRGEDDDRRGTDGE